MQAGGRSRLLDGAIGTAVGAYAFLDDLFVGPIVVALAAWLPWFVVLGVAAIVLTAVNILCCNWLQNRWELWVEGHGGKLEARLEKMRSGRFFKYPVRWMQSESILTFTAAAGLIGAVIIVAASRFVGGKPIGRRRVKWASIAYSAGFAATYCGIGLGIGDLVRAI